MSHFQIVVSVAALFILIFLSAFFSAAETGLMAINRYRLRHKAQLKKRSAILILKLLKRPDRVLGMILIGNNCANIIAASLTTLIVVNLFGEKAVILSTVILTLIILVLAEVAPKTLAALYPDKVSRIIAWPISLLLKMFYPIVWSLNMLSNGLLRLFGVKLTSQVTEPLTRDELRSVVYETSGRVSGQYQHMLIGILDLNKMTVDDVMVPSHEIVGIDLDLEWNEVLQQLAKSDHDWLPLYREDINQVTGILHLRELMHETLIGSDIDKAKLLMMLHEPYFIPSGTPLNIQLINFQSQRKRLALIVDEYGEVTGLVTLEDILEEIVGDFTTNVAEAGKVIEFQTDGSYLVDGSITVRELNRATKWKLPVKGPRTLNGLIVEHLQTIPRSGVCVRIEGHPMEIVEVEENTVKVARIFPMSE